MAAPATLAPLAPLLTLDDATLDALTDRFHAHGFGPEALADVEEVLPEFPMPVREPLVRECLARRPGAVSTLLALFAYGFDVPRAAAAEALGEALLAALEGALVASAPEGRVRAAFVVMPIGA